MAGLLEERQSGVPESDAPKAVLRLPLEEAELPGKVLSASS